MPRQLAYSELMPCSFQVGASKPLRRRGEDTWLKLGWDEAFQIAAKTYLNIATNYSGEKGAHFLEKQGFAHRIERACAVWAGVTL